MPICSVGWELFNAINSSEVSAPVTPKAAPQISVSVQISVHRRLGRVRDSKM